MTIQERIQADMKTALKAGEKDRLTVLRMLLADLKNFREGGGFDSLDEEQEQTVLRKAQKMRLDAVEAANAAGRTEMSENEAREAAWIAEYLPQQMDEETTRSAVVALLAELGIQDKRDIGRFMKEWMARHKATSDARLVQRVLGEALSST
ncbi:MAG: GatB/YqeY domain-containing protein [Planctomycetes bacterium]|nr:GatB/YqeY domain-containing protein [Planctomycetota bacterium]